MSVCTSMWGVSLGQNEVLEVNNADGLCPEPAIRHCLDVVLGGQGLKDGDSEHNVLRLSCYHLEGRTHKVRKQEHTTIIICSLRKTADM